MFQKRTGAFVISSYLCFNIISLIETMPDIDLVLLQFINVMNLLDPLLHFSSCFFVVNWVHICDVWWQKVWWNECICLVSEGWSSCTLGE